VPDLTADTLGEIAVAGPISPDSIPLSRAVSDQQLRALIGDDPQPTQVVATIAPGPGGRGWQYTASAVKQFADYVASHSLNGYLGHMTDDDLGRKFEAPSIHWIGARFDGETAVIRGLVDKSATDVARWLRSRRITAPSWLTRPVLSKRGGQTVVDSFAEIISLDLAPLGREGMPSAAIIYAGEQRAADDPFGPPRALSADMSVWDVRRDDLYPTTINPAEPRPSSQGGSPNMGVFGREAGRPAV
jgi:hypothetical protein